MSTAPPPRRSHLALLALVAALLGAPPAAIGITNPCFLCRAAIGARFSASAAKAVSLTAVCHDKNGTKGETSACNEEIMSTGEAPDFAPDGQFLRLLDRVGTRVASRCPAAEPVLTNVLANYPNDNPLEILDPRVYSGGEAPCFLVALRAWGREVIGADDLSAMAMLTSLSCRTAAGRMGAKLVKKVLRASVLCQTNLDRIATAGGPTPLGAIDPGCYVAPDAGSVARATARLERACGDQGITDFGGCTPLPDCVIEKSVETAHRLAAATYVPTLAGPDRVACLCVDGATPFRCTPNDVCTNLGSAADACEPLCASHGGVIATTCSVGHADCQ